MSNFETIKITDIKPAQYNPRNIDDENFAKLKNSLHQFGLVDPIVINLKNKNTIIGGHQRYRALLEEEKHDDLYLIRLGDIGWVFDTPDLKIEDENMEKLLNISLNQTNMMGEWDNDKLKGIFVDFKLEDIDLELTGFDDWEINNISPLLSNNDYDEEDDDMDMLSQIERNNEMPKKEDTTETYDISGEPVKTEKAKEEEPVQHNPNIPREEPSFDESIADDIKTIKCPNCGYELPYK